MSHYIFLVQWVFICENLPSQSRVTVLQPFVIVNVSCHEYKYTLQTTLLATGAGTECMCITLPVRGHECVNVCAKPWVHTECHTERGTLLYMIKTSKTHWFFDFSHTNTHCLPLTFSILSSCSFLFKLVDSVFAPFKACVLCALICDSDYPTPSFLPS